MNLKLNVLKIVLPIFILSSCVATSETARFKGTEYYSESGSKVIVGEILTEQDFPVSNIEIKVNQDFIKYPEVAERAGIEGVVELYVDISPDGKVEKTRVTRGIGGGCDMASVELIRNSEFVIISNNNNKNTVSERYYISILYVL